MVAKARGNTSSPRPKNLPAAALKVKEIDYHGA